MKAVGKRLYITVDEDKIEQVTTEGVQKDFTPKKIKATTATVNFIGDTVLEGRFKEGDKIFIGVNYPESPTEIPGFGFYTIISEDAVMAIL